MRRRLIGLMFVSVLPAVAFVTYSGWRVYNQELQNAANETQTVVRLIVAEHESNIRDAGLVLGGVALALPNSAAWTEPDCGRRLAKLVAFNPSYAQLLVADRSGQVVCSATPLDRQPYIGDRDYFKRAVADKSFTTSSVLVGRIRGIRIVTVAQPILDTSGDVAAVLVAAIDLQWIGSRLASANIPHSSDIALLSPDGTVLNSYRRPGLIGKIFVSASRIGTADEGTFESVGGDDVRRLISFKRLSRDPDVLLEVVYPKDEIYSKVARALLGPLIAFIALIVSTLLVAWIAGELLIGRPIARLIEAASRLGRGDLKARTNLPYSPDGVGSLARKLDELASQAENKSRALNALSAGNRAIVHETDEQALLEAMCKVVVQSGAYACAAVSYAIADKEKHVVVKASAGNDHGYFADLRSVTWADEEAGRGTIGTVIRTSQRCVARDIESEPRLQMWRLPLLQRGWRSTASFPIIVERQCIGALTLLTCKPDAFDDAEIRLLDELADDLSFGISVIRERERRKEIERIAEHATTHDPVADLPNLGSFLRHLRKQLETARSQGEPLAVLFVHLPRLHELFEALGYEAGNQIIRVLAERLSLAHDMLHHVARVGFDDFAVALPMSDFDAASTVAKEFVSSLQLPLVTASSKIDMQVAFGISFFPGHGDSPDLLLRRAGIAARDAARKGLSFATYQGTSDRESPARLEMAAELREAMEQRQLFLQYQPKIDLGTRQVHAVEALLRWRKSDGSIVPPGEFVPVAEHTGLIRPITEQVIEMAIRQQRQWLDEGRSLPIAVNLSARNLYDPRLLGRFEGLLTTWGVPANLIEFEVTESALMEEPAVAKALISALRAKGSRTYIDDFGTGYSSLNYLVGLPFHALKIDRSFVVQMKQSPQARAVIESVISMAHALDLRVIAEGVETKDELDELRAMGCDEAQGYFIARPMNAAELFSFAGVRRQTVST
ncbi:MAG: EAL domain-containing protein [Betaproteobacteria bacterium]|nr:EAL domain-containing protein [Betaproteobacteria bacterium]